MDPTTTLSYIVAAIALIFLGYERFIAARKMNGDFIESLAKASHEAVEMSKDMVSSLRQEVEELRTKVTRLEAVLHEYYGCARPDCPIRQRLVEAGLIPPARLSKYTTRSKNALE